MNSLKLFKLANPCDVFFQPVVKLSIDFQRDKTKLLKARRYRWRPFNLPNGGCWWISTESPEEELKWLEETSMDPRSQFYCTEIPPNKRYSDRIWE